MIVLTLSLELSSLRLVEFSSTEGRSTTKREEIRCFSKEASHRQVFIQEIKDALRDIKKLWGLSDSIVPLHCILSSDFSLLRVATFEKASRFISTSRLVQRDAAQFLPLPLEEVSVAYREINRIKRHGSRTVIYAAIRTYFLEAITGAIRSAGFSIQKMSLLPLSLHASWKSPKEILLMDLTEQTVSCFLVSSEKNLCHACFYSLGNFSNGLCEQKIGLPLLLIAYLKKEILFLIHSKSFPGPCWIIKPHAAERNATSLMLFLKKEFSIPFVVIDPCILLSANSDTKKSFIKTRLDRIRLPSLLYRQEYTLTSEKKSSWKYFLGIKRYHITSIGKFTAPSIAAFKNKQRVLFFIYALIFFILLFSPLSLVFDYVENKEIDKEAAKASFCLKQRELELKQLRQDVEKREESERVEEKLKELQTAHDRWPLLIIELQKCAPPRGIWITQLTPIIKEIKENKARSEISALEIKGLYLEGMNGEQLVHEYANKLATSSLFLSPKKKSPILLCSKEDRTAYAYSFSLQLLLYSPIWQ